MYTPLELEKIEFEKSIGGYKKHSVDEVFAVLRTEYETLYKENIAYKDKITMLEDLVSKYKAMEDAMNNALLMARTAGDEAIKNSRERAADIIKEAEFQVAVMKKDAEDSLKEVCHKRDGLTRELSVFAAKNISILQSQIELLKQLRHESGKAVDFNMGAGSDSADNEE
jgi:cell division initiation protein